MLGFVFSSLHFAGVTLFFLTPADVVELVDTLS